MTEVAGERAAPSNWLTVLETRALFELGAMAAASPLLRMVGRGDEHPVLVLPGFTADDRSTAPLRAMLRGQGYWTHGWQLGRNMGPTPRVVDGLLDRLETLHSRHGRKVSLVGWSLGGIFARALARERPDAVRQVITLGSPFRMVDGDRSAATGVWESVKNLHEEDLLELHRREREREPLAVPASSIYTRTDGVVRWWLCLDDDGPYRENIEVRGSHSGLGFNPAVALVVSDRLAQALGDWRPFHPSAWLRYLYPVPARWRDEAGRSAA